MHKHITFFKQFWAVTQPYWKSEEKRIAWLLLITIIALNLGHVALLVLFNRWYNTFYTSLQNLDKTAFIHNILYFSFLAVLNIIVAVYSIYLAQMLTIRWRRWLTTYFLNRWLDKENHYRMQITGQPTDNPDQRISEDINQFIDLTLSLSLGLLNAVVTLCSFSLVLWTLSGALNFHIGSFGIHIPGYMVWAALIYAIFGTLLTNKIGKSLVKLNFNQQRFEADFRFGMTRLRENSENIAFYQGEAQEKLGFTNLFSLIFSNYWQIMKRQKNLTWFTAFYGQFALIFPFLVACPKLFAKQITLGDVMQIASAFGSVQGALSYIINAYVGIATWKATCDRLISFTQHIQTVEQIEAFKRTYTEEMHISVQNLQIKLPNGHILGENMQLNLAQGDSLFITGPSGSGKTTLLRTLSGLWPFAEGTVIIPEKANILFIPQKPYLPLGTLKKVLCYPQQVDHISDLQVQETLQFCQLGHFCGMLHEEADWSKMFSVGEQQRIGFIRALLTYPDFLFLDEATSALDDAAEYYLYQLLKTHCPKTCIISVGHKMSLKGWANHEFVMTQTPRTPFP